MGNDSVKQGSRVIDLEGGEWEVITVYPPSRYSQQSVGFCSLRCVLPPPSPKTVEKRFDIGTVAWKPLPELKVKRADV